MANSNYSMTILLYAVTNLLAIIYFRNFFRETLFLDDIFNNLEFFIFIFILSFLFAILIHELGHLVFGNLVHFKLIQMNIWFIAFKRNVSLNKFQLFINKSKLFSFNGSTYMSPSDMDYFSVRQYFFLSGGIIFNFLSSIFIFAIMAYPDLPRTIWESLVIFSYISLSLAILNALPINTGESILDGRKIYNIHSNEQFRYCLRIDGLNALGIRPKEWPNQIPFNSFDSSYKSEYDFYLKIFEMQSLLDQKEYSFFQKSLDDLITSFTKASVQIQGSILLLGAIYYAFCVNQIDNSIKCLEVGKKNFKLNSLSRSLLAIIDSKIANKKEEFDYNLQILLELLNDNNMVGSKKFYENVLIFQ